MKITGYKFILMILLMSIFEHSVLAQNNSGIEMPNVLLPSPTASELGKFALAGNSLSTGSATTHIELYNLKTKNLSVSVGVDYSGNGLKVDATSSRVGMNWMLSAGGVVSRTVYGLPDNTTGYLNPPADFPNTTGQALKEYLSAVKLGYDTQPDVFTFSFSGYSGRFIIVNNVIKKLEQNNLKITGTFEEGFVITTPDGVKYSFQEVESSTSMSSANSFYKGKIDNAWFLTRIEHPHGDRIFFNYTSCTFNYDASKSNSYIFFEGSDGGCGPNGCAAIPTYEVTTTIRNFGVYLSGIGTNSATTGSLKFNYTPRSDIQGDYSLISIVYSDKNNQPVKTTAFNYQSATDRFFLKKIVHGDQNYSFEYNNINNLPVRLSYSQDHYGYYNGKTNRSMIPQPFDSRYIDAFQSRGFGDRRPDADYSKMGMLRKIIYPTGGSDSLEYEANRTFTNQTIDCNNPTASESIFVSGSSSFKQQNIYTSKVLHVTCAQQVTINIGCNANSHADNGWPRYPSGEYLTSAQIKNVNTGAIQEVEVQAPVDQHKVGYFYFSPGDYVVVLKVRGDAGGIFAFSYNKGQELNGSMEVPGLRVKRIISYDPISQKSTVKKYEYTDPATKRESGVVYRSDPSYDSRVNRYVKCNSGGEQGGGVFRFQTCTYTKLSSTPNFNLSNQSGNHIYYSYVTELNGENSENGGTEHKFSVFMDRFPAMVAGYSIYGAPISNSGVYSQSLETYQKIFRQAGATRVPLKEVFTHFKDDSRLSERSTFFTVSADPTSEVVNTVLPVTPSLSDYTGINVEEYDLIAKWIYPDSVKTVTYNSDGSNPVLTAKAYSYNNTNHQLVNTEQSTRSDESVHQTSYLYPQDNITGLSDTAETARQQLITDYNISAVLEQSESTKGTLMQKKRINFKKWSNTITAPEIIETSSQGGPFEQRVRFYAYDNRGNILSQGMASGSVNSYIWSYGGTYPVAEIKNLDYTSVKNTLGEANIESFSNQLNPDKVAIENFLSPVKTLSPNSWISINTLKPLNGPGSATDPKGLSVFYDYDEYQRLNIVRDQNKNIVRSIQYKYGNQPQVSFYKSAAISRTFTKNDCSSGLGGTQVSYVLAEGAYTSTISQLDADNKSRADVDLNGQAYANSTGGCAVIECRGRDKKIINGVCETGIKVYTRSDWVRDHYVCTFHYVWSDHSESADFGESGSSPCL